MPGQDELIEAGRAAVAAAAEQLASKEPGSDADVLATAVRAGLKALAAKAPGRSVEVRVPPYGAVQCVAGTRHTRGTPGAVVETDPVTWVRLAHGDETFAAAVADGRVRAGGERSDLSALFPL